MSWASSRTRRAPAPQLAPLGTRRASKSGGPRWGAAARTRGPITTYAKDLLAQAEPAAERRAQRQVNLRKAASERAAATQHVQHRAPPAQAPAPASNIPALELGAARQVAAAPAPPSARGTVAGGLQPAKAHLWSTGDVGDWLASLGLAKYVSTFAENEVSGAVLLDVGKEDLDYMEVKALAHRKLLLKAIARLATAVQTGQDEAAAAPTPRGGGSRAGGGGVAAEAAPAPAPAMVHWSQASSGMAPVAGPGEGTAAPANPLAAAAAAEHDEEAERSAFKEAVMAWRRGGTAAPEAPAGVAVANAGTDTAWSNPAEAPAGAGKASADGSRGRGGGGRFAASLGASTNQGSGGAFAATLGQAPAPATGNPLLAPGPSEEAEHAAFRDAVLAWRGQAPAAPAQPASASTAAGTSSGGKVGSASVGLGEKAAKVLGVDPATVEESSWYTGYKHLCVTAAAARPCRFTATARPTPHAGSKATPRGQPQMWRLSQLTSRPCTPPGNKVPPSNPRRQPLQKPAQPPRKSNPRLQQQHRAPLACLSKRREGKPKKLSWSHQEARSSRARCCSLTIWRRCRVRRGRLPQPPQRTSERTARCPSWMRVHCQSCTPRPPGCSPRLPLRGLPRQRASEAPPHATFGACQWTTDDVQHISRPSHPIHSQNCRFCPAAASCTPATCHHCHHVEQGCRHHCPGCGRRPHRGPCHEHHRQRVGEQGHQGGRAGLHREAGHLPQRAGEAGACPPWHRPISAPRIGARTDDAPRPCRPSPTAPTSWVAPTPRRLAALTWTAPCSALWLMCVVHCPMADTPVCPASGSGTSHARCRRPRRP